MTKFVIWSSIGAVSLQTREVPGGQGDAKSHLTLAGFGPLLSAQSGGFRTVEIYALALAVPNTDQPARSRVHDGRKTDGGEGGQGASRPARAGTGSMPSCPSQ